MAARDRSQRVRIKGAAELARAFKQLDSDLPKQLRVEFKGIASRVASEVAGKVDRKTGRAAGSVKATATTRAAAIAAGGPKAPYYQFLDFGGSVGRGHIPGKGGSGAIKRDWMGKPGGDGRWLYPTISENRDETADAADEAIKTVAKRNGFETRGHV